MLAAAIRNTRQRTGSLALQHSRSMGYVRIIVREDIGKGYKDDVIQVKAGYARNYLIPQKKAVYATRENFLKLNVPDPDQETVEQRRERLAREASADDMDYKSHALLKTYLRNKALKIWRNVDPAQPDVTSPGMVDAKVLREKLSRQLKIDLERHEKIHIHAAPLLFAETTEEEMEALLAGYKEEEPCTVQLRRVGEFVAKISLRGGFSTPLKFTILPR